MARVTAFGLALLALAVVLAVSGLTKIPARQQTEDAIEALRIPLVPRALGAALLPWAELALAVGLLVLRGPLLVAAAVLALLLAVTYTVVIARALRFPEPVTCSCFGRFGAAKVSRTTLWRNLALTVVAAVAVVAAVLGQHVWGLVSENPWWVVMAGLVATLFALVAAGSGTPAPAPYAVAADPEEELDYLRLPIPYGQLRTADGKDLTTLRDLASTQARLLLFLSAGCGSCRRTAENLDAWAERLAPAVGVVPIYSYEPGEVPFAVPWYLQPEGNVSRVLEAHGTPSAVLLGADGMLAGGPIGGEDSVRRFVDDILEQIHGAADEGADAEETVSGSVL